MQNFPDPIPDVKNNTRRDPASRTCPKCNSDDTRAFEIVHAEGTSSGTFAAGSYTFGAGTTLTKGQTSNQSVLASITQPPKKPVWQLGAIVWVFFASFLLSMVFVSYLTEIAGVVRLLCVFVMTCGLTVGAYLFERKRIEKLQAEYENALAKWKRSWICMRCGNSWRRVPAVGK